MHIQLLLFASLKDALRTDTLTLGTARQRAHQRRIATFGRARAENCAWLGHVRVGAQSRIRGVGRRGAGERRNRAHSTRSGGSGSILPNDYAPFVHVREGEISLEEVARRWSNKRAARGGGLHVRGICALDFARPGRRVARRHRVFGLRGVYPDGRAKLREIALEVAAKWDAACAVTHRHRALNGWRAECFHRRRVGAPRGGFRGVPLCHRRNQSPRPDLEARTSRDGAWWKE